MHKQSKMAETHLNETHQTKRSELGGKSCGRADLSSDCLQQHNLLLSRRRWWTHCNLIAFFNNINPARLMNPARYLLSSILKSRGPFSRIMRQPQNRAPPPHPQPFSALSLSAALLFSSLLPRQRDRERERDRGRSLPWQHCGTEQLIID